VWSSFVAAGSRGAHRGGCSTAADIGAEGMPVRGRRWARWRRLAGRRVDSGRGGA
jgi:hypothetical protein